MPTMLTRLVFAAAIACAAAPALGAGMPDYGTKNFNPGGDAPSYFTNENGAVLGAAASDNSEFSNDVSVRSAQSVAEPRHSARTASRRHGKLAAGRKTASQGTAHSRATGHSAHQAMAKRSRTGSSGWSAKSARTAHPTTVTAKTRSTRIGHAKPAKPSVRHASIKPTARKG